MKMQMSDDHVSSDQGLPPIDVRDHRPGAAVESAQGSDGLRDFSLFDSNSFGDIKDGFFVDFLDPEEGDSSPPPGIQKFADASQGHIPQPTRRRSKIVDKLNADDFDEGAERNAFLIIDEHAKRLFASKSSAKNVNASVEYFFTAKDSSEDITFELCCDVLGARIDVMRLRIQYEWWLRGSIFTGPFSFRTVPVPPTIAGEITYYGGEEGYALARESWVQPGMAHDELIECVASLDDYPVSRLRTAIESLEHRFLMSSQAGRWYVTGRNPLLMNMQAESMGVQLIRGGSFYWSRLFGRNE